MKNKLIRRELWYKYREIIVSAWQEQKTTLKRNYRRDETEFMPAVLEIQHKPPHPLPRITLWLMCSLLVLTFLWAIFGYIDIIATAQGKVIPSGFVKYVQPMNSATVTKILVSDGQYVKKNQLLIELDTTISQAEVDKTRNDYQQAALDSIRYHNLLARLNNQPEQGWESGLNPNGLSPSNFNSELLANSQQQLQNQWLELQDKLATNQAQQSQQDAAMRTSQALISKFQQTLPLLKEKESDYLELYNKKFMSQHGYLDVAKQRIDLQQDLAQEQGKIKEIHSQKQQLKRQYDLIISDFKLNCGEKLLQASQQAAHLHSQLIQAEQNQDYNQLRAPESGYVQQLAIHTVGGVVTPAQPLLVIVPQHDGIVAEVQLENKDIGFVKAGQSAEIKVAAFPFTRYGTIHGTVKSVSADAVEDKKEQLQYNVYIQLSTNTMNINGAIVPLTPGMMLTAEIKTGKRKIIDYFLSPLIQNTTEALHER